MKELPEHKCGLYLGHNDHKDMYQINGIPIPL